MTTLGCSLHISVNPPPYPALLILFAVFPSSPVFDQAATERYGAIIHDGTWPVEGLFGLSHSLSFLLPYPPVCSSILGFLPQRGVVPHLSPLYSRRGPSIAEGSKHHIRFAGNLCPCWAIIGKRFKFGEKMVVRCPINIAFRRSNLPFTTTDLFKTPAVKRIGGIVELSLQFIFTRVLMTIVNIKAMG